MTFIIKSGVSHLKFIIFIPGSGVYDRHHSQSNSISILASILRCQLELPVGTLGFVSFIVLSLHAMSLYSCISDRFTYF